jgi:hypothetical protein
VDPEENRMQAFEMWVLRRMEHVLRIERNTCEEVLGTVGEDRRLQGEIWKRQSRWLQQVLLGEGMLKAVIGGEDMG